jgi:hypothetical protein
VSHEDLIKNGYVFACRAISTAFKNGGDQATLRNLLGYLVNTFDIFKGAN